MVYISKTITCEEIIFKVTLIHGIVITFEFEKDGKTYIAAYTQLNGISEPCPSLFDNVEEILVDIDRSVLHIIHNNKGRHIIILSQRTDVVISKQAHDEQSKKESNTCADTNQVIQSNEELFESFTKIELLNREISIIKSKYNKLIGKKIAKLEKLII